MNTQNKDKNDMDSAYIRDKDKAHLRGATKQTIKSKTTSPE